MRIFFATDVHGSEVCWRKFVNAAKYYEADVLILGGDMTGKAVIPIIRERPGLWSSSFLEQELTLHSEQEVAELERSVANRGYYTVRMSREDYNAITSGERGRPADIVNQIYEEQALARLRQWIEFAAERLDGKIRAFCCPGNDDYLGIDEVFPQSEVVQNGEGKVLDLGNGFSLMSTGWTNRTPWKTHRELDEDALLDRLERIASGAESPSKLICNIHCPPFASGLDEAPELDEDLHPKFAGRSLVPVGSKAVRTFLERHQPLLSLHGHIHEGRGLTRIGKTLTINPGSQYEQGTLLGAIIDVGLKGIQRYNLTQG
jgi:Icc-related predicted phosphoesterase